ncbi:MAG: hypothetical protein L6Q98_08195 [Anaerolineae bacterium]|nr:hypothetical protein [Anaerolineae bacterium]NUQ02570.1 hypothetical protein [Anaerolineae bacterium]
MDIHLFDSAPVPKEQVRIEELEVAVYPDHFRIFIHIRVSLFQERPNLLLVARALDGRIAAELSIIETMHHDMEFTMHLRGRDDTAGQYTLVAELFYDTRNPPQDIRKQPFTVPPETGDTQS